MRLGRRDSTAHLGHLPLTSLIDVVFLLLIYFLVASSMTVGESKLTAALQVEKRAAGKAADLQPQIVIVDAAPDGSALYKLGERLMRDQDALATILRSLPKESGVFVKVRNGARVEAAAAALQACKDAGFSRITYVPAS
ncbi:MAG: ExbD/TolR family protein [Phycisphaerales bacterium]